MPQVMGNAHGLLFLPVKLYQYKSLDTPEHIRLIKILPGKLWDDVQIETHHTSLQLPGASLTQRLSITEVRETLPEGWQIFETIERRYLFWNSSTSESSWDHPNPKISRIIYVPLPTFPVIHSCPNMRCFHACGPTAHCRMWQ